MAIGIAVAALGAWWPLGAAGDDSVPPARAGAIAELRYDTTPGKPMELAREGEPAERIVARRDGGRFVLEVARNVGKQYETGRAALTEAEWRALEKVVADHALAKWRARPTGNQAFDYSSSGFSIRAAGGKTINEQHWSQPAADEQQPGALAAALGALAKAKVAAPRLFYFGY
ncbi:MAG TPA: hypothetical protein VFF06_05115 [Polyangia bacterium]|nr:hypothetical protein [Polyangia bacterium]